MVGEDDVKIPVSMMGEPEHILERYRALVRAGQSPGMASILASRRCPGLETDTAHYAGMKPLEETCGKAYAAQVKAQARAAGITISDNSRFNGTIADHRGGGDPTAWIHAGDGKSTFRERLRKTGGGGDDFGLEVNTSLVGERYAKKKAGVMGRRREAKAREAALAELRNR